MQVQNLQRIESGDYYIMTDEIELNTARQNTNGYLIEKEPFYVQSKNEVAIFEAAYDARLPVMLKGPTGCGKTRYVEYMAYRLKRPLITVACHEDLFASDLIGRYLLKSNETVWVDGPLTNAVRIGAICYLDEIVEARKDTTVVIHPLTDNRRTLSIDKKSEIIHAHKGFMMVISYNPGYQSVFCAWNMDATDGRRCTRTCSVWNDQCTNVLDRSCLGEHHPAAHAPTL